MSETGRPSEFELIARWFAPMAAPGGLSLEDDAAFLAPPPGRDLVLTKDMLVAGVHFFPDDPPDAIARKALRVNLSDLAAKGAEPAGFLLGLALPPDWTAGWLERFARGLADDASRYACPILGGDTVGARGSLTLSITALGTVPSGRMIRRGNASPGDRLFVTGSIGDAAVGLQVQLGRYDRIEPALADDHRAHLVSRYRLPEPRLSLVPALGRHARAAMDVSDGFVGDLTKMLALAGVGADVDLAAVPLSVPVRAVVKGAPAARDVAFTGGDDYELLVAVGPADAEAFRTEAYAAGVPATEVGLVTGKGAPLRFRDGDRDRSFGLGSFVHF